MLREIKKYLVLVVLLLVIGSTSYAAYSQEQTQYTYDIVETNSDRLTKDEALDHTHEVIGEVIVPEADIYVPLVQAQSSGTDNIAMADGVAHDSTTGLPGDGEPIVIAGHREKEFYKLYDISEGMIVVLKVGDNYNYYQTTKTGQFADDAIETVFGGDEEVVRLYTCYPRANGTYITGRYGIEAEPIERSEVPVGVVKEVENE